MAVRGRGVGELDDEALLAIGVLAIAGAGVAGLLLRRAGLLGGHGDLAGARLLASGIVAGLLRLLVSTLAVAAGLLAAALALRLVWTARTLRSRVAYAVLPPPNFDPRPEAIEAFGQQMLGARRRVLAWLDRPASAFRVQLMSTPDGRLLYVIELPVRFQGTLFNAVATAYPGVELRPLVEVLGQVNR